MTWNLTLGSATFKTHFPVHKKAMRKSRWLQHIAEHYYSKRLGHPFIVLVLALILGVFYFSALTREVSAIQQKAIAQTKVRKMLLAEEMQHNLHFATLMSHIIAKQYDLNRELCAQHPALQKFQNYPELNSYGLSGFIDEGADAKLSGSLSGIGELSQIDAATRCEITAALAIDGAMSRLGKDDKRITSAYYTSRRGFAYVAPKLRLSSYRMKPDDYYHDLWKLAAPDNNPNRNAIITSLYEDGFGKGLMITLSNPVWLGDDFLGVFSFDFTAKTLMQFLTVGSVIGDSIIADKANFLVAQTAEIKPKQKLEIDSLALPSETLVRLGDNWWYRESVWQEELYVLHRFPVRATYWQAVNGTTDVLLALLAFVLLYSLLLKSLSAQEQMLELSRKDSLTHIYNRRGFLDSANATINITKRNNKYWGLMIFDIDHFKKVNDTFGHDAGDAVLKEIAELVEKNIRVGDILGRWGGEEFVVFLYDGDINGNKLLAERLRAMVEENIILPDAKPVTISIGVASGGLDISLQSAISKADEYLYRAKQRGRNCVCAEESA